VTNTNSVSSDDAFIDGIAAMPASDQRGALIDVVLDTATWQIAQPSDVDGRAR
jgi:hypothetical protein